jgi:uncharacterized RDD family membrane protein YckC
MAERAPSEQASRGSVASRLAGATGLERAVAGVVEETIVRTVESEAVLQALERIVEDGRLQAAIERAIDQEMVEDAVRRAIESEVADRIWAEILASEKAQLLVERVAEAPEVRVAIAQQGFSLITDIGRQVSRITEALDDVAERVAHAVIRSKEHEAETNQAGLVTRGVAFAIDVGLLAGFLSITSGLLASIVPAIFGDRTDGLSAAAVVGLTIAGLLFGAGVFVTFWSLIGQTPGMRFLGIRLVVSADGSHEVGLRRSIRRVIAIPFAVIPFGLGILAILISPRRHALQDYVAGTEVIYDESSAPWSLAPREWVHVEADVAEPPPERRTRRSGRAS